MRLPFEGNFRLTQPYGNKHLTNGNPYARFGMQGHNGLDYATPSGTKIFAPHSGKVLEIADEGSDGYGRYIKIQNDNEGSVLAHLQEVKVKIGDFVDQGQFVAISDNTGNSTGAHLHWGYYTLPRNRQNGYSGYIDQLPLLGGVNVDTQKIIDDLRTERDKNWNLYQDERKKNAVLEAELTACENKPIPVNEDTKILAELRSIIKKIIGI